MSDRASAPRLKVPGRPDPSEPSHPRPSAETPRAKMETLGLRAFYGEREVLRGIDLAILEREVIAVIGPSGCGKSTFLRSLNRMHEVVQGARVAGRVLLDATDIYARGVDPVAVRRRVGDAVGFALGVWTWHVSLNSLRHADTSLWPPSSSGFSSNHRFMPAPRSRSRPTRPIISAMCSA